MLVHLVITLAQFLVALPLGVALHEAGHWLFGTLVGVRSQLVSIGQGPVAFERQLGFTLLRIHGVPVGGANAIFISPCSRPRLRLWLGVLGGPLMNALLAAGCGALGFWGAALAMGLLAFANLMPFKLDGGMTDGTQLATIPFLTDDEVKARYADSIGFAGTLELDRTELFRAEHRFRQALTVFPSRSARLDLARLRLVWGDFAEARALLEGLVREPLTVNMRKAVCRELAIIYVVQGLDDEALCRAEQALALDPSGRWEAGAWGAVQLARGNVEGALLALQYGARRHEDYWVHGALLCFHAEALAKAGKPAQAQGALKAAENLCGMESLLVRARAAALPSG